MVVAATTVAKTTRNKNMLVTQSEVRILLFIVTCYGNINDGVCEKKKKKKKKK